MATCSRCKKQFKTLEDEYLDHPCPYCGYYPYEEKEEEEEGGDE